MIKLKRKKKDKVVVTGGCGFIGSHLVDELIKSDYEVHVVDDLSAESNDQFYFNEDAFYYEADITWHNFPHKTVFKNTKRVFHLAAESRIGPAIRNPVRATEVNVLGTTKMLEYSRQYGIERFLYSSTSSVYGLGCPLPTDETAPIDCLNPYSASKYGGEEMVRMYNKLYGLHTCVFRYFNVFGNRSPVKGPYAPVIGLFFKQKQKNQALKIVGDGEQRRDFVHVSDIVNANILYSSLENSKITTRPVLLNIGSGKNYTINEIASVISDKHEHIPAREGEARHTLANISKAKEYIKYIPHIDVIDWIKNELQPL
jgi:UDP-glucose 4-epimerase